LVSVNKVDETIRRHSKVTGLSDVKVSTISYSSEYDYLIVGYKNGNIDFLREGENPFNLQDIKRRIMTSEKQINNIIFYGRYAYLACSFAIVALDIENKEIKETYYLGENGNYLKVNDIAILDNRLYAATDYGIYTASLINSNLLDYSYWSKLTFIPQSDNPYKLVENYNGQIFAVYKNLTTGSDQIIVISGNESHPWEFQSDTLVNDLNSVNGYLAVGYQSNGSIFQNFNLIREFQVSGIRSVHIDKEGKIYTASSYSGFVNVKDDNTIRYYSINGPRFCEAGRVASAGDNIWVSSGNSYRLYNPKAVYSYIDGRWNSITNEENLTMRKFGSTDRIAIDPDDASHLFVSSYIFGITEIRNGNVIKLFSVDSTDIFSEIQRVIGIRAAGLQMDHEGNLWTLLDLVANPLFIMDREGNWTRPEIVNPILAKNTLYADMIITSSNHIWILTHNSEIIVIEKEGESYRTKTFSIKNQSDNLINKAICLEEDHEGNIWVGTFNGPVIYHSAQNVFKLKSVTGYQVPISRNDGTNVIDYLLNGDAIMDIKVDGGNRKWLATQNSGVFLVSPDGEETLVNFRNDNSPLLSNLVTGIDINEKSGEVFFATDYGLVSYGGSATTGFDEYTDVYVFPNPVKKEYDGPITITGLVENSIVKITDVSGALVWETTSLGGQAIWDGRNFSGRKVATGVYLVLLATSDGSQSHVTKILFMH